MTWVPLGRRASDSSDERSGVDGGATAVGIAGGGQSDGSGPIGDSSYAHGWGGQSSSGSGVIQAEGSSAVDDQSVGAADGPGDGERIARANHVEDGVAGENDGALIK